MPLTWTSYKLNPRHASYFSRAVTGRLMISTDVEWTDRLRSYDGTPGCRTSPMTATLSLMAAGEWKPVLRMTFGVGVVGLLYDKNDDNLVALQPDRALSPDHRLDRLPRICSAYEQAVATLKKLADTLFTPSKLAAQAEPQEPPVPVVPPPPARPVAPPAPVEPPVVDNALRVTVSGPARAGKSTLAALITEALGRYGFDIEVHDGPACRTNADGLLGDGDARFRRTQAVAVKQHPIVVRTVQTNAAPAENRR